MLSIYNSLPAGLLDMTPDNIETVLSGPSLIHLKGEKKRPLFVSILQHGNEHTGLYAIQKLLKKYYNKKLPRSLSIFVANVFAAKKNLRKIKGQVDYNRAWPGTPYVDSVEYALMNKVFSEMQARQPFLSIDIHNNTGLNPYYSCIGRIDKPFINLAYLFNPIMVYFTVPHGTQAIAFSQLCPSITIECGLSGDPDGITSSLSLLKECLNMDKLSDRSHAKQTQLFHTVGIVKTSWKYSLGYEDSSKDISFISGLDKFNFKVLKKNYFIGKFKEKKGSKPLLVHNEQGQDITDYYFNFKRGEIYTNRAFYPSMITPDVRVAKEDCFCYIIERIKLD